VEYNKFKYNTISKDLKTLKSLKCVTNVNKLTENHNILFFVANNQLKYYIQNNTIEFITDFNDNNIKTIPITLKEDEIIQDIAATIIDEEQ
jgi:hypothetical protein